MTPEIDAYLIEKPAPFQTALRRLHETLEAILADHTQCMSYAMPSFRHPSGKVTIGYAAFARHIGLYPHSGSVIGLIDCTPFKTSKSGITFPPETLPPPALILEIIATRLAQIGHATPLRFHSG